MHAHRKAAQKIKVSEAQREAQACTADVTAVNRFSSENLPLNQCGEHAGAYTPQQDGSRTAAELCREEKKRGVGTLTATTAGTRVV